MSPPAHFDKSLWLLAGFKEVDNKGCRFGGDSAHFMGHLLETAYEPSLLGYHTRFTQRRGRLWLRAFQSVRKHGDEAGSPVKH